jgi:hypothetical protein
MNISGEDGEIGARMTKEKQYENTHLLLEWLNTKSY